MSTDVTMKEAALLSAAVAAYLAKPRGEVTALSKEIAEVTKLWEAFKVLLRQVAEEEAKASVKRTLEDFGEELKKSMREEFIKIPMGTLEKRMDRLDKAVRSLRRRLDAIERAGIKLPSERSTVAAQTKSIWSLTGRRELMLSRSRTTRRRKVKWYRSMR